VAAGLVPLALGSQTLGSVVRPAAFNGVVGFKPSFGAIPRLGVHHLSPSLDHIGFFARGVDDVAFALSQLAGSSDRDRHGRPLPNFRVDIDQGVSPLNAPRLAIVRFAKWTKAESEQQQVFDATVAKLRDAGAGIAEIELAELDRTNWSAINTILTSEGAVIFAELVARYPDRSSDHLKSLVETGTAHSATDYLAAKTLQDKLRDAFTIEMSGYDAVLTLPAFGEAPKGLSYTGDAEYCAPWTLLGVPALSLPAGFGKNGLPLGIQIVGPYREDYRTLRVAKWVESALGFAPGIAKVQ
jgi:Asp-tRNA(Asn)/Glu-tRNA(Gln) amidotransferase A subunit family amidase